MKPLKDIFKKILVPELSIISFFVFVGTLAGNPPINIVTDSLSLIVMVIVCFYFGSKFINNFFQKNRLDVSTFDRILAFVGLILMLTPPVIGYMQGMGAFLSLFLMFCFITSFQIGETPVQNKIKSIPGFDVLSHGITWGVLTISAGTLYSGLETTTRGWLVLLLGFYLYASFFLLRELTSSKALADKSSLIMYLGESKSLELVAIFQLFGLVGLTTLYLSEYENLFSHNSVFYILFTFFSLCGIFQTLVWSKNPTQRKTFNYRFYLIFFNLSLMSWVVAEWLSLG